MDSVPEPYVCRVWRREGVGPEAACGTDRQPEGEMLIATGCNKVFDIGGARVAG